MSRTHHHGDKNKQKQYGEDWRWMQSEPKWWRKLMKHKPQRAKQRQSISEVMQGDEDVLFPLDRKPHEYFW